MNNYYPFVNTPLPYAYNALESCIDEKTMRLHHDRHLQTYIDNLNEIMKKNPKLQKFSLTELLCDVCGLPPDLRKPVADNAGGVYNHRLYFETLSPGCADDYENRLTEDICKSWGSLDCFEKELRAAALSVFGSGYAWLVASCKKLRIITTPNQNTPLAKGCSPILNVDVWEHAYYLKHSNKRADYISDWLRAVNWNKANENYLRCINE